MEQKLLNLNKMISEKNSKKNNLKKQFWKLSDELLKRLYGYWINSIYIYSEQRETEPLLIVAQSNAIRTTQIKERIDKTQQNSKCRLCGDWDETINHIISEYSKLAQMEYKTRHDWVGQGDLLGDV